MIEQVLMNLAVNARDAMSKGGRILITTTPLDIDANYAQQHPEAHIGKMVCLSVTDTGCGMKRETLDRIFEPFFSTKEVGKGTGLGLATVYGIVSQHCGWIEVQSEVNVGTVFNIFLPATDRPVDSGSDTTFITRPAAARGRNETILLVEDEPTLREWVKHVLTEQGYRVLEASTGVEALRVWDEQNGKIDLLLTDMVMPEGMTGRDLAVQLKARAPDLRIIYTSGYSAEVLSKDSVLAEIPFLPKPYPAPQLALLIRDCLDAKPAVRPA